MIVLIDQPNELINVFSSKGIEQIPFDEADDLKDIIGNQKVLYVTKVVSATYASIIELVNSLMPEEEEEVLPDEFYEGDNDDDRVFYLRSTNKGPVFLAEINMQFMGPGDGKEITAELANCIKRSVSIQAMIKNGHLEIVVASKMQRLARTIGRKQGKEQAIRQAKKDKQLDDIIVQDSRSGSAADAAAGGSMFDGSGDVDDGPEEIRL